MKRPRESRLAALASRMELTPYEAGDYPSGGRRFAAACCSAALVGVIVNSAIDFICDEGPCPSMLRFRPV